MDEEVYNTIDDKKNKMNNDPDEETWCNFEDVSWCDHNNDAIDCDVNTPCLPPRPTERQYIELALVRIGNSKEIQRGDVTPIAKKTSKSIPNTITTIDINSASIRTSCLHPDSPVITNPPISDVSLFDRSTCRLLVSSERKSTGGTRPQTMQIEGKTTKKVADVYSMPEKGEDANDEHTYLPFVQGQQSESDVAKFYSGELDHENNMAPLKNVMAKLTWTDPENCDTTFTLDGQRNEKAFLLAEPYTDLSSASTQHRNTGQVERTEKADYITPIQPEYVDVSSPANTNESDENLLSMPLSTNDRTDDDNGGVENISSSTPVLCNLPSSFGYLDLDGSQVHIDDINDLRRYANNEKHKHTDNDNEYITPIDSDMDCLPLAQVYDEWDGSKIEAGEVQKCQGGEGNYMVFDGAAQ